MTLHPFPRQILNLPQSIVTPYSIILIPIRSKIYFPIFYILYFYLCHPSVETRLEKHPCHLMAALCCEKCTLQEIIYHMQGFKECLQQKLCQQFISLREDVPFLIYKPCRWHFTKSENTFSYYYHVQSWSERLIFCTRYFQIHFLDQNVFLHWQTARQQWCDDFRTIR